MRIKSIIFLAIICITVNSFLYAQDNSSAFNTMSVGVNVIKDIHTGGFQQTWDAQIGAEGYLSTAFYLGNLQSGVSYCAYGSSGINKPDFKLFLFYLQWDYEIRLPLSAGLSLGGRFGLTEMRFSENSIVSDKNLLSESEFTAGPVVKFTLPVYKGWSFNISGYYLTTFTYNRMYSLFVGGGINKSFSTPAWFKEFLQ